MFKRPDDSENFEAIRNLLARRREMLPPQSYFDGILPDFHNRQRAALLQPRYTIVSRLFGAWESLVSALEPVPALRAVAVLSCAALLLVAGLKVSWTDSGSAGALSLRLSDSERYAYSQPLDGRAVSSLDERIDAASLEAPGLDKSRVMPHYVIAQAPTSYDTSMAF